MKHQRRIKAFLLAFVLLATAIPFANADEYAKELETIEKQPVITEELAKVMETAKEYELIPVDIWLYGIDTEEVQAEVKERIQINREDIDLAAEADATRMREEIEQVRSNLLEKGEEVSEAFELEQLAKVEMVTTFSSERIDKLRFQCWFTGCL